MATGQQITLRLTIGDPVLGPLIHSKTRRVNPYYSGKHQSARKVLSSVAGSIVESSDEPVVRQVDSLLDEFGYSESA
jgi:hypothetical protein